MPDELALLTVADAAKYLHVHPNYLYIRIRSGRIPATRLGNKYVLKMTDITAYLQSLQNQPKAK